MKLDKIDFNEIAQSIENAPVGEKSEAIANAIQEALNIQKGELVKEYESMNLQVAQNSEMASKFGLRTLNKEETEFYQKVTTGAFEGTDEKNLLPETTFNYVFEDLKTARPLFNYIKWTPAGLTKWITGEVTGEAKWGALDSKITDEMKTALKTLDFETNKLSAFAFVPKGIIDLGFTWIDKYIREVLIEANAAGLEKSFVVGDGKDGPIGLTKALTGATDGVHIDRVATKITDFTPLGLSKVLADLTDEGKRAVTKVILIVNPLDDFSLVKPATSFLTASGEYRTVFPVTTEVIPVVGTPRGKAVLYLPNTYEAGISEMGIYTSDDFNFLDHVRTYKVVSYGNGRIKKENMAAYLDISEVKPLAFNVNVMNKEEDTPGA